MPLLQIEGAVAEDPDDGYYKALAAAVITDAFRAGDVAFFRSEMLDFWADVVGASAAALRDKFFATIQREGFGQNQPETIT